MGQFLLQAPAPEQRQEAGGAALASLQLDTAAPDAGGAATVLGVTTLAGEADPLGAETEGFRVMAHKLGAYTDDVYHTLSPAMGTVYTTNREYMDNILRFTMLLLGKFELEDPCGPF